MIFDKITSISVILFGPSNWEQWYKNTMVTVFCQMYKLFEPDTISVLNEPVTSVRPVDKPALEGAETPQV